MRWLPLLIVLASLRADGRPVRSDFGERDRPPTRCPATDSWQKFRHCQLRTVTFELVQDLPAAKLTAVESRHRRGSKRLELYLLTDTAWVKSSFRVDVNERTELLAFAALTSDMYRIDLGFVSPTWVTLDEASQRSALVRRRLTHVCRAGGGCRQVLTSCDVLVHGKTIASFRGEPVWDGRTLKLRGDVRNTNRYCKPPRSLLLESSAP